MYHYLHDPSDAKSLSDDIVIMIYQDSQENLWIGTRDGGLNRLVLENGLPTGRFERYMANAHDMHSLNNNEVACMLEDQAGNLWI